MKRLSATVIALTLPFTAGAQEAAEATEAGKEGPWSGNASLGYLATSGNTENQSFNGGFEVGYTSGKWFHRLGGKAVKNSQDKETTAEAYEMGWKSEYSFTENSYLFGRVDWRKDRFSGYEQQISESLGYGRRLIDSEAHTLNAEIGVGARQQTLRDAASTEEDDVILRGAMDYTWRFSETGQFMQQLAVESGSSNTYFESVSEVKAALIGQLALVASYTIKSNSDVPVGTEKTDTFTALSLEYAW